MGKTAPTAQRIVDRRKQIINLIKAKGALSKNDIFKQTRYSISTVIATVDDLHRDGLILPCGSGQAAMGRPSLLYALNAEYGYTIGVDINSGMICVALINFKQETVCTLQQRIHSEMTTLQQIVDLVPALIDQLLAKIPANPNILCIGVAAPGLIDIAKGSILYYSRFANERNINITQKLSRQYQCPVYLDKSLNCLATAYKEQEQGQRALNDMILISIRTGVGMSCILNGSIYRGASGQAGEIGHMRLPDSTALCKCKKVGCLDAEVSNYSIARKMDGILEKLEDAPETAMTTAKKIELFVRMVQENQPDCVGILDEICRHLGYAVSQVINLFNPSDVLFYGEVTQCGALFLSQLKKHIAEELLNTGEKPVALAVAELSDHAFAEGAAYYAFDRYLQPGSPSRL